MNELYFSGYGYFRVNTDDYDRAVGIFLEAAANAGIDIILDELELRDLDGNPIDGEQRTSRYSDNLKEKRK